MFAKILKANPYHDKSGRFTSKDKGATATLGLNDFRAALGMRASIPASRVSVGGEDMYAFTNGKRPSGKGSWMFSPKRSINFDTDKAGKDFFQSPYDTKYSDAKRMAKEWAGRKGIRSINVMT